MTADQFAKSANCSDLITRLEQAEAGSRELDLEILALLGWTYSRRLSPHGYWESPAWWVATGYDSLPSPTTSLDAIVALIGEKLPEWSWGVGSDGQAVVSSSPEGRYVAFGVFAKTAPLALCIALLRAIEDGEHG